MTATGSNHDRTPVFGDMKAMASRGGMLHWVDYPKILVAPVFVSISAPERTFAKQGVNDI